ncbi:MAG: response regulator [Candidatus Eisenbacteria sp.]|nr:response regulator [Candidatus Eisenbacteria bacterium]
MNRGSQPDTDRGPAHREYASALGHEIRRPLNGILGTIDLLMAGAHDPHQKDLVTRLEGHASSLVHLVNDLIDLARMDANDLELDEFDFDLRGALQTVVTSLALEAEQKGLALRYWVDDDVPSTLCGDPGRLKQALFNLVAGAIRFTTAGEIVIHVAGERASDDGIDLEIEVDCAGTVAFPEKLVSALSSPGRAEGGFALGSLGLGLLIARRVAALMGGDLGIDPADAHGNRLHLRVRLGASQEVGEDVSQVFPGVLRGLKALLVDTSVESRGILKEFLEGWGVIVEEAGSSAAALGKMTLAASDDAPFRLVMLDDGMTGSSGFDLAQQIKQRPDLCAATVVLLTSTGMRGDAARCRKVGVSAYLTKPIRPSRLLEALALALGSASQEGAGVLITRHTLDETRRGGRMELSRDGTGEAFPRTDAA